MTLSVRPYAPNDNSRLRDICLRSARERPFLPYCEEPELACAFFLNPYVALEPESCFVAEIDGAIVGYLAGARNNAAFAALAAQYLRRRLPSLFWLHATAMLQRRISSPITHRAVASSWWQIARGRWQDSDVSQKFDPSRYPARCHLQLAPQAEGKRAGLALMLKFHEYLKANGVPGQHSKVLEEATRGRYSRMLVALGFRIVHEETFTRAERPALVHPGSWRDVVLVRDF